MSTRRTYILLSDALAIVRGSFGDQDSDDYRDGFAAGRYMAAVSIADALARQSTAFDRERFLKDAGVTS